MKIAVYTSIIGKYDNLVTPKVKPDGFDFICFTDQDLQSDVWKIKKVLPIYKDNTRTARKYKILPHRYLPEYDISIWVDGNENIVGNVSEMLDVYLINSNMAVYDHMSCWDKRNCIYKEADAIFQLGRKNMDRTPERGTKNFKDNPNIIKQQIEKYKSEGFPKDFGLIVSGVIFRKHNNPDIVKCMEDWWVELKYGSKRDQLSFNYCTWKNNTNFNWIRQDIRDDGYFLEVRHTKK